MSRYTEAKARRHEVEMIRNFVRNEVENGNSLEVVLGYLNAKLRELEKDVLVGAFDA